MSHAKCLIFDPEHSKVSKFALSMVSIMQSV